MPRRCAGSTWRCGSEGVLKGDTKFYVSTVHDEEDVKKTLAAFAVALDAEVEFRKG